MRKILLPIIILLFLTHPKLSAQKENNIWVFPPFYGLDFNGPAPAAITSKVPWVAINAVASVCDPKGQLLFYTNTDTIWDRNGNPIPICSTTAWSGGVSSTDDDHTYISYNDPQGVLILPVLDNPNRYYVFILSGSSAFFGASLRAFRLNYSVMDMTLNKGLGDIVPGMAHIPVDSNLDGAMTAVPGNNCNIWLLLHARNDTSFKAYEITIAGVSPTPVISRAGTFTSIGSYSNGEMAVSPNRKKLAIVDVNTLFIPPLGTELCDFDPNTGTVSNAMMLDTLALDESVCFSPDNSKLYVSEYGPAYPKGGLVQYDITLSSPAAIIASQIAIADTFDICSPPCGAPGEIRDGPDGKIYCTANASDTNGVSQYIGCINNPNLAGASCNYVNNAIYFPPVPGGFGGGLAECLGNDFVKPIMQPGDTLYSRTDTTLCIPSNTDSIILRAPSGFFHYVWNDGSTDSMHVVKRSGLYTVRSSSYCAVRIDTFAVTQTNVSFTLGHDTTFCRRPFPYTLRVSLPGANYLWQDGSNDSVYTVTRSGRYSVTVSKNRCEDSGAVNVAFINNPQHLGNDTAICYGQPIQLTLQANVPPGAIAVWSDGTLDPTYLVQDTGKYWVTVTDGPCQFSDSIYLSLQLCECAFNMPSAFSPNGDRKNDLFRPVIQPGCPVANYQLTIYNRWGQMVWMSYSPSEGWDGTYHGIPQEVGDYMYILQFNGGTSNKKYSRKGDVTLVR